LKDSKADGTATLFAAGNRSPPPAGDADLRRAHSPCAPEDRQPPSEFPAAEARQPPPVV